MTISLQNVVPQFLEKEKIARSQIWGHHHVFNKGERIQIVAPSGSGKTSLVHFLYGLRNEYTGEIKFNEQDLRSLTAPALADLRADKVSIIFQDLRLFKDFTAEKNIDVKRLLSPFHASSKIMAMAERLGIANKMNQSAGTCSYGEQQRIAIIRALQQPFGFIIMDEPFSHLDERNRQIAMDLIEEEAVARQATIILADLKPIDFFSAQHILHL